MYYHIYNVWINDNVGCCNVVISADDKEEDEPSITHPYISFSSSYVIQK